MFDLLLEITQAYTQIGMLIGAVICLAIGGAILGNSLYWRFHARRVQGTIVGVLSKGATYTPVYRYALPDGRSVEAKSDSSSGWSWGKETGRVVPLMISASNPGKVREADSFLLDIVGLVFVIPGVLFGYTTLTAYPTTHATWIVAAGMLLYLAHRGYRLMIPKGERASSIAEWRRQRHLDDPPDLSELKPIEQLLAQPNAPPAWQSRLSEAKWAVPAMAALAIALGAIGVYQGDRIWRLEMNGERAPGEVVRLEEQSSSDSDAYYPVIRFRVQSDTIVEFRDRIGSDPPSYRTGDEVTVLYLPDNPRSTAIIDRGLWNWTISALLLSFAAILLWIVATTLRHHTKVPRLQLSG